MGEVINDGSTVPARALARAVEAFHGVTYYSPEMADLTDHGYRGWWHAYFGYRPAPMGAVDAPLVAAVFYNFAPRMVARAVPGVWDILAPAEALAVRADRVGRALLRNFGPEPAAGVAEAVTALRGALDQCRVAGRPLYAAYAGLDWPTDPMLALWHGCTLARELRFDVHNTALAASEVDGVMSHVLMAAFGHGNRATILPIRGWTEDEWDAGVAALAERGWVTADGDLTEAGRSARRAIEATTDGLGRDLMSGLGVTGLGSVMSALEPLVGHLRRTGEGPGTWPPPHLTRQ